VEEVIGCEILNFFLLKLAVIVACKIPSFSTPLMLVYKAIDDIRYVIRQICLKSRWMAGSSFHVPYCVAEWLGPRSTCLNYCVPQKFYNRYLCVP